MKLTELHPKYASWPNNERRDLIFDCPVCKNHRIAVPISGDRKWEKSGDDFETTTLSPSIHYNPQKSNPTTCEWHGFIKNGEIINA